MKISYVILPFENTEYLIRCVNSLYRQLGEDYEVILAENDFGEETEKIEEFLKSRQGLLRISKPGYAGTKQASYPEVSPAEPESRQKTASIESRKEKISKAFSLVSAESDYVMFLDVDTVAAPVCAKAILECGQSGLVIPAVAIKKEDGFVYDSPDITAIQKNFDEYNPQRFCFGRTVFTEFLPEYLEDNEAFSVFLLSVFARETKISIMKDVCLYAVSFSALNSQEETAYEAQKVHCNAVFSKLPGIRDAETRIVIFEKLINRLSPFLEDDNPEIRKGAYEILQDFYKGVQGDFLLKRFMERKTAAAFEDFSVMDYSEYAAYRNYVMGMKQDAVSGEAVALDKLLSDMKAAVESAKKDTDKIWKEIEKARKDISGLAQSQNQAIAAVIHAMPVPSSPSGSPVDIPLMYREGRLGLKTIIRSFGGWLGYKLSRKK